MHMQKSPTYFRIFKELSDWLSRNAKGREVGIILEMFWAYSQNKNWWAKELLSLETISSLNWMWRVHFFRVIYKDWMRTPSNLNFWFKKQTKNLETAVTDSGHCLKYGAAYFTVFCTVVIKINAAHMTRIMSFITIFFISNKGFIKKA
jgi:hypothetical protein